MSDSLAERMKEYEPHDRFLQEDWVIMRIDGRAFHTHCRKLPRFDTSLRWAMLQSTETLIKDIGRPMILAYTNSDEASILMCADVGKVTEHWFGGRTQKMASIGASVFTQVFNSVMGDFVDWKAAFDARVFTIPSNDAPNYFVWRMRDCRRNAVNIACRDRYGTEAVSIEEKQEATLDIPLSFLYGTTITRGCKSLVATSPTYADFAKLIAEGRDG